MTEIEQELEDQYNRVEILLLGAAEEAAVAIFFTMIIKIMTITGKVEAGKMELPDILVPMRVETILLEVQDLLRLALIMQKASVEWEHLASTCIMAILM